MSKKISIPFDSLPYPNSNDSLYYLRYRLLKNSNNQFSEWSNIYAIGENISYSVSGGNINTSYSGNQLSISWDYAKIIKDGNSAQPIGKLSNYDIWIRWATQSYGNISSGSWERFARISGTSVNITIPVGKTYSSIEIYRPGTPIIRSSTNNFLLYSKYDTHLS
jgi:hypothetical protein